MPNDKRRGTKQKEELCSHRAEARHADGDQDVDKREEDIIYKAEESVKLLCKPVLLAAAILHSF